MIVNAYSVLAAFLAVLQFLLGAAVAVAGLRALRRAPAAIAEERFYLPFLLSIVLLLVALVSWPLLYLLLQSWVPEWPGVMCIQGVTQVGAMGFGPERWLPRLLDALRWTKPLLVFLTGAWLVLHLANRRTRTDPLTRAVLVAMVAGGFVATADAAVESTYLFLDKHESNLATGCCSVAETMDPAPVPELPPHGSAPAFFGTVALIAAGIGLALPRPSRARVAPLAAAAALSLLVGPAFASSVVAPRVLGLPHHHCAYCLLAQRPETVLGIALFVLGAFAVGWALVAPSRRLLSIALFGYLGAGLFAGVELAVA